MAFGLFESKEEKERKARVKAINAQILAFENDVAKEVASLDEITKLDDEKIALLKQVVQLWGKEGWQEAEALLKKTIPVLINKELFFLGREAQLMSEEDKIAALLKGETPYSGGLPIGKHWTADWQQLANVTGIEEEYTTRIKNINVSIVNLIEILKKQLGDFEQKSCEELLRSNFMEGASNANKEIAGLLSALEKEFWAIQNRVMEKRLTAMASEEEMEQKDIADLFGRVKTQGGFIFYTWMSAYDYHTVAEKNINDSGRIKLEHIMITVGAIPTRKYSDLWAGISLYCPRAIIYTVLPGELRNYIDTNSSETPIAIIYSVDCSPRFGRSTISCSGVIVGEKDGLALVNLAYNKPKEIVALFKVVGTELVMPTSRSGEKVPESFFEPAADSSYLSGNPNLFRLDKIIVAEQNDLYWFIGGKPGSTYWWRLGEPKLSIKEMDEQFEKRFLKPFK